MTRRGGCGGGGHGRCGAGPRHRPAALNGRKYPTGRRGVIRLSLRSKMPPIPGTVPAPESLESGAALDHGLDEVGDDRHGGQRAARGAPRGGSQASREGPRGRATPRARRPPIATATPPTAPSQVFLGLVSGAMGWRPMARPVKSAPTSQNFATATTQRQRTAGARRQEVASPGDGGHDPHEVLHEERNIDQAEEGGGQRLQPLVGRPLGKHPDAEDHRCEGDQRMGRQSKTGLGPWRERDHAAENEAEPGEGCVARRRHERVELAQRQDGDSDDDDDGPVRAEEPQHGEKQEPEDDGAGDALCHRVPGAILRPRPASVARWSSRSAARGAHSPRPPPPGPTS